MTLIDKAEALAILAPAPNSKGGLWATRKQALYEQVAALPARDVGVPADVKDYAIDVSEAYDTMMEVQRNPAGAWQVIQALAGHIAALAPTDAAQAREAAHVIAKNGAEATAAAMILHIAETLRAKGKAVLTTGDDFGAQVLQYADAIGETRA